MKIMKEAHSLEFIRIDTHDGRPLWYRASRLTGGWEPIELSSMKPYADQIKTAHPKQLVMGVTYFQINE